MSMWGLLGRLRRWAAPRPAVGHVFTLKGWFTGETGFYCDISIRDIDLETAIMAAIRIIDNWTVPETEIVAMRFADDRDLPRTAQTTSVGRRRHFGIYLGRRMFGDWRS
ncbi:MAG: hypothetical protein AAGE03_17615 [Pseudomonadota bacterium]